MINKFNNRAIRYINWGGFITDRPIIKFLYKLTQELTRRLAPTLI